MNYALNDRNTRTAQNAIHPFYRLAKAAGAAAVAASFAERGHRTDQNLLTLSMIFPESRETPPAPEELLALPESRTPAFVSHEERIDAAVFRTRAGEETAYAFRNGVLEPTPEKPSTQQALAAGKTSVLFKYPTTDTRPDTEAVLSRACRCLSNTQGLPVHLNGKDSEEPRLLSGSSFLNRSLYHEHVSTPYGLLVVAVQEDTGIFDNFSAAGRLRTLKLPRIRPAFQENYRTPPAYHAVIEAPKGIGPHPALLEPAVLQTGGRRPQARAKPPGRRLEDHLPPLQDQARHRSQLRPVDPGPQSRDRLPRTRGARQPLERRRPRRPRPQTRPDTTQGRKHRHRGHPGCPRSQAHRDRRRDRPPAAPRRRRPRHPKVLLEEGPPPDHQGSLQGHRQERLPPVPTHRRGAPPPRLPD